MQTFRRTGSSLGNSPTSFSNPFRSSGSFSLSYREVTSPGFGTTTTLLSGSFPLSASLILPQTPFIEAFQQTNQALQTVEQGGRNLWGGLSPNVRLDLAAVEGEVISLSSRIPFIEMTGYFVGAGASVAGTIMTVQQWQAGRASLRDVEISIVTTVVGLIPGPAGVVAAFGQLAYDEWGVRGG